MAKQGDKTPGKRHAVVTELDTISLGGRVYGAAVIQQWRRWASIAYLTDTILGQPGGDKAQVTAITFRGRESDRPALLVAKARVGKRLVVGFHRGSSAADALEGFSLRWAKGSVDWRDDKPWARDEAGENGGREPLGEPPGL